MKAELKAFGPESYQGGPLLALDTSGREGTVALALLAGGETRGPPVALRVLGERKLGEDEEHAALLVPTIRGLLLDMDMAPRDLEGVVVGSGPGSFTGVRVGAATAKGIAWSLRRPLWAISSLAGAAAAVESEPARPRLVLFDARGERLYAAAFRMGRERFDTLLPPLATTVDEVLERHVPPGAVLMGDGAVRHQALFEAGGNRVLSPPAGKPSAEGLLRVLALHPTLAPVDDLNRWEPDYLRESGAERLWKTKRRWSDA